MIVTLLHQLQFCGAENEDFTTAGSLQYDLSSLQYATANFNDENKLGEGGFGGVYKVKSYVNTNHNLVKKLCAKLRDNKIGMEWVMI